MLHATLPFHHYAVAGPYSGSMARLGWQSCWLVHGSLPGMHLMVAGAHVAQQSLTWPWHSHSRSHGWQQSPDSHGDGRM
jgi:hypothetical protein